MDNSVLDGLLLGFSQALLVENLLMILLGCFLGTWLGMMPGLGPASGVALLLPFTYGMDSGGALILFAGIYFGAMYGGAIASILINTPGDAGAIMTTVDGHPMALKGRAGSALFLAALSSFAGGTISIVGLTFLGNSLARVALYFGPAEYAALLIFALLGTASFVQESRVRGLISMALGLLIGTVGIDLQTGAMRFSFGKAELLDGISLMPVIVGVYAISEGLRGFGRIATGNAVRVAQVGRMIASKAELARSWLAMIRGSLIGFIVGVLPGAGATIATFMAYSVEFRLSKRKDEFGKGAPEGLAAPESANNASAGGALVPLLTLGVPGSGTTAVLLGALMIYGVQPGPRMFSEYPELTWGIISSLYVSNIVLLILNIPLIRVFVQLLKTPPLLLNTAIIIIGVSGMYVISLSLFDCYLVLGFGVLGVIMRTYGFPLAPMVLGVALSNLLEQSLRQALALAGGNWIELLSKPVVAVLIASSFGFVLFVAAKGVLKKTRASATA